MIIDCPCGKKKFSVKDELIPAKGRLLQCGECDREWFYSKNINTINETNVEIPDDEIAQESFGIIEDKYDDDVFEELSQPIKGLIVVDSSIYSSIHFLVFPIPDCIDVLVGLYIFAFFFVINGRGGRI